MSWSDITVGQRAAPEDQRQRVCLDEWWQETADMANRGWHRFWKRPHKECGEWKIIKPPKVDAEIIQGGDE